MGKVVGDEVEQRAFGVTHTYRLMAIEPHTNRQGHPSQILTWAGVCAACGADFTTTSGPAIKPDMPRGCPLHRPWTKVMANDKALRGKRRVWFSHAFGHRQKWRIS